MASKTAHDAARAKAAKQKKLLLALSPLLLLAFFFAYHTMSKLHSPQSAAPPPAATTPAAPVSDGTPVSATTPSSATPLVAPPAGTGKLGGLGNLATKDPFHDQGPQATGSSGSTSTDGASSKTAKTKVSIPPPASAVISVNGHLASVAVGQIFPATKDPTTNGIFRLKKLTAKTAKVAVVGGSYTNGSNVLTLTVNSIVTLVNTADGKRYTLILYPQGTPAPGGASPATTTTTTTTTTGP
jgi:hypothetical protein